MDTSIGILNETLGWRVVGSLEVRRFGKTYFFPPSFHILNVPPISCPWGPASSVSSTWAPGQKAMKLVVLIAVLSLRTTPCSAWDLLGARQWGEGDGGE